MTTIQKQALGKMGDNGAVNIKGTWIWRDDIRNNEAVARIVLEATK